MKKLVLIISPVLLWIGLTALGFGAQSLTNLIEIPIVIAVSVALSFPSKNLDFKTLLFIALGFTILLRYFMPVLPE